MKNCEKYRAGNFLFVKEKRGSFSYITCSTLTREWHVRFREDIMMYAVLVSLIDAKESDKLSSLATLWYGHCVMTHSANYYAVVGKALVDDVNAAEVPEVTQEEDDLCLEEVADMERKEAELNVVKEDGK